SGLLFFGLLYSPVEMILSLFSGMLSRRNEYQADAFAAENVADKSSMIQALKNLARDNLSNLTPHPFYVFLNYSHPPVLDRVKKIKIH
ncbi:MAG TPA: M48 family peptidase, partial [Firmicutes bacterium]|nr:M48 family peptidase [Bacillota bacterium]